MIKYETPKKELVFYTWEEMEKYTNRKRLYVKKLSNIENIKNGVWQVLMEPEVKPRKGYNK